MADQTSTSAVRDAAELIAAAEELLAVADSPMEVALHIGTIADAAKALRANHLADVLDHVRYRAGRVLDTRDAGWLTSEAGKIVTPDPEPTDDDTPRELYDSVDELRGRVLGDG